LAQAQSVGHRPIERVLQIFGLERYIMKDSWSFIKLTPKNLI
jgi:hypothetical protein